MLEFKPLTLADRAIYKEYEKISGTPASFYNFTNLFVWRNFVVAKYAIIDGFLCTVTCVNGKCYTYFPLGKGNPETAIKKLWEHFGKNLHLVFLTNDMAEYVEKTFPGKFVIEKDRGNFDYVYLAESLITLKGKKLHSKRNHLNTFKKTYNYKFTKISKDIIPDCLLAAENWLTGRENQVMARQESVAIKEAFDNFDALELFGGALWADNKIIGFSIGERMSKDTAIIHIEKADTDYKGSYAAINNMFASEFLKDFKYINREEDMGIEGLRKAKLSYYPCQLTEISMAVPAE